MRIHKEGIIPILGVFIVLLVLGGLILWLAPPSVFIIYAVLGVAFMVFFINFFRNPKRDIEKKDNKIVYAPADGKVVVIEETIENEYYKDKRLQVSIFMNPLNVHVNRYPISGLVKYFRYHQGKYLVAWHPKSSTENERTTTVIDDGKRSILMRQIAGALARRIVAYAQEGQAAAQGDDMGFIKLGSRVDIYLPLDAKINVKIDDKVHGNWTVIAHLP
jgi:phosphatidylserine decarboxylase